MTKKGWSVVLLFCFALLGGICAGYMTSDFSKKSDIVAAENENQNTENDETPFIMSPEPEKEVSSVSGEKYMLTLSDNSLFIYKIHDDGSMEIVESKEADTASLRREDSESLFKGILFDTMTEAREGLEDYVN